MRAFLRAVRKATLLICDLGGVLCILAALGWALNGPIILGLIGVFVLLVGWAVERWA
jgi:hypothetical protein